MELGKTPVEKHEHVLVGLSSSPSNRKIIEEAAENYKNLKKAIANDINKAIETWDKVRESKKEQRIERFLLFIVMMQAAITIKILWDYFIGV